MPLTPEEQTELEQLKQHAAAFQQQKVEQMDKPLEYPLIDPIDLVAGGLAGRMATGAVSAAAEKSGLSSIPGRLMSLATRTKYTPEVAGTLLNEGLVGTRGMIQGQVKSGITKYGKDLESAVAQIPENISHRPAADAVRSLRSKLTATGTDIPLSGTESGLKAIAKRAAEIEGRGIPATPEAALSFKRGAGKLEFPNGEVSHALSSEIGGAERSAYGQELEKAYGSAFPGQENVVSGANSKLHALLTAKDALAETGAAPPSLAGFLKGALGTSSVYPSVAAHTANLIGKIAPPIVAGAGYAGERAIHRLPENTLNISQDKQPSQQWTDQDKQELQELYQKAALMVK